MITYEIPKHATPIFDGKFVKEWLVVVVCMWPNNADILKKNNPF